MNEPADVRRDNRAAIERMEADLLPLPQVDTPLTHHFAPGVYLREISMPAGSFVLGHEHTTGHFNIVLSGSARVVIVGESGEFGEATRITAPCVFSSGPGVRKALLIDEDMRWLTVHATNETDVEKLESVLVRKSEAFEAFSRIQNQLQKEIA